MIDSNYLKLSISKQCYLLDLPRSRYYYKKIIFSEYDLFLMSLIDRIHTAQPTFGRRRIHAQINRYLIIENMNPVNIKKIHRLMKIMDIKTIYQKPSLSSNGNKQYIHPYLLRNLKISKANQVWASDITYIPFNNGFIYLYAIIDVYSRVIVGWQISVTLHNDFVINTIETAFKRHGIPQIKNSDQGSHFTSKEYIDLLKKNKIMISMDGKNRAKDNIYIERFWRTIKYEYLFLNDFDNIYELEKGIYNYIHFYNNYRIHQSLNYKIPMEIYNSKSYLKNIQEKFTFDPAIPEYHLEEDVNKIIKKFQKQRNRNLYKLKSDLISAEKKVKKSRSERKVEKIFKT